MTNKKSDATAVVLFQVTSVRGPEVVLTAVTDPNQSESQSISSGGPPSARLILAVSNTAMLSALGLGTFHSLELRPAAQPGAQA